MITTVQKWGDNLAIRIPKPIAQDVRLCAGTRIELREERQRLVIVPVSRPTFTLAELLKGITKKNLHTEADFGGAEGKEVC